MTDMVAPGASAVAWRHVGLSLGRVEHWHDGLGEFARQLGMALAQQAREPGAQAIHLHFHLPARWHGVFGDHVSYSDTHDLQRWWHRSPRRFALWHILHQHNRYRAPQGATRVIETVHDLNFLHQKSPQKIRAYRARMARRLMQRHAVIAISQHVAEDLQRELAPLQVPLHVIHNGATDLSHVARRAPAGLEGLGSYLLHISRMAPSKNVAAMLDLVAAWPEQAFVFAGGASAYSAEVQRLAAERSLHNLRIVLDIDEAQKAWLYAHCAGFLFPSLSEGFGLPPLEAMHFGKPTFLSRLTSLPEVGGDAAFYVDSFEPASMRATVQAGLRACEDDDARRDAIVAHARRFSWSRCAAAYLSLYASLLEAPSPPATRPVAAASQGARR